MADNKWTRPDVRPPRLFTGQKEKDLVKQVSDEILERVVGQPILYYPLDLNTSQYHPLYGEAIVKNFLPPIHVYALIDYAANITEMTDFGPDKKLELTVRFHQRRLGEDQNLYIREGDMILYDSYHFEIMSLDQRTVLYGEANPSFDIIAKCVLARKGTFDAS
jgi:hypothetical protein